MENETVIHELKSLISRIYHQWVNGNKSTARAMINQVPKDRLAYIVFCLSNVAVVDRQYREMETFFREMIK